VLAVGAATAPLGGRLRPRVELKVGAVPSRDSVLLPPAVGQQ